MSTIVYVGPFDAVEIETKPGVFVTVKNGETVTVGDPSGFLEQSDNWQTPKVSPTTKQEK